MEESDTYLAILDEGQVKATRASILAFGEERLGTPEESIKQQLGNVADLARPHAHGSASCESCYVAGGP